LQGGQQVLTAGPRRRHLGSRHGPMRVMSYSRPDSHDRPSCWGDNALFSAERLEFDCSKYESHTLGNEQI
jgi:hypothetical protein